jgi:hypothetical protein
MRTPHGSIRPFFLPAVLLLALGGLSAPAPAQQVQITGSMSNFDVHQGSMEVADNFELDFLGDIDANEPRLVAAGLLPLSSATFSRQIQRTANGLRGNRLR